MGRIIGLRLSREVGDGEEFAYAGFWLVLVEGWSVRSFRD